MFTRMTKAAAAALIALLVAVTLLVSSCDTNVSDDDDADTSPSIVGTWASSYGDGFTVTDTEFTAYSSVSSKTLYFKGTILSHTAFTASSGYVSLFLTATDGGTWTPTLNKYYVIYWTGLSSSGVQESTPYKSGSEYNGLDTQAAAEAEYTYENGYFSPVDYSRQ
jgi:hypothetical protein